jgi:hypothetical protein
MGLVRPTAYQLSRSRRISEFGFPWCPPETPELLIPRAVPGPRARSAVDAGAVAAVNDRENLEGWPREKRRQASVRRHLDGMPIGQDNKVVML